MKFLIDVNVGKSIETLLIEKGFDILPIRDIDPRMSDSDILNLAVEQGRIVITQDKDFGELVYNSGMQHAGVLLLRMEGESRDNKIKIMHEIITKHLNLLENHFCVYKDKSLRVRE